MAANKKGFQQLEHVWDLRWRARSDLQWLCNNILNYTKVDPVIHKPVMQHLQQFPLPDYETARQADKILSNGQFLYTPWADPYVVLEGHRRRAVFMSRGYFKTTLNTVAHSVQWLLNFPQMAIGTFFSSGDKAEAALREIKEHFRSNAKLRELFPDYCPRVRVNDWGTAKNFTLPNRTGVLERLGLPPRKEQSMTALSIDQAKAGYHFDCIKCSDLVEQPNIVTPQLRQYIKTEFALIPKMLVHQVGGNGGWVDVEGTFYNLDDLHCDLINAWQEEEQLGQPHRWDIFVQGVYKRDTETPKYTPSEMKLPFMLDKDGRKVPTWPEVDPIDKLEAEERDPHEGGIVYACQRVLDIRSYSGSQRPFVNPPRYKTKTLYRSIPIVYKMMAIDLADTTGPKSNPSVITVAGYDRDGRCYVEEIQRGKWGPDETIDRIFETFKRHGSSMLRKIIIEDYGYTHGLKPSIDRRSQTDICFPPFHFETADRTQKKVTRIINALQPPYVAGDLFFVEPLNQDETLAKEIKVVLERELADCTQHSTGPSDDILDTLAYLYIARTYFGPELTRGGVIQTPEARNRLQTEQYEKLRREMLFPTSREEHFDPYKIVSGW